jgi:hypothetical protein
MNSPILSNAAGAAIGSAMGGGASTKDSTYLSPGTGYTGDQIRGTTPIGGIGDITVTARDPGVDTIDTRINDHATETGDGTLGGGGGGGSPGGGLPPWLQKIVGAAGSGNPYVSGAMAGMDMLQGAQEEVEAMNQADFQRKRNMAFSSPQYLEWANSFWGG